MAAAVGGAVDGGGVGGGGGSGRSRSFSTLVTLVSGSSRATAASQCSALLRRCSTSSAGSFDSAPGLPRALDLRDLMPLRMSLSRAFSPRSS
eukprot:2179133-Prymnesium_polylepis.2